MKNKRLFMASVALLVVACMVVMTVGWAGDASASRDHQGRNEASRTQLVESVQIAIGRIPGNINAQNRDLFYTTLGTARDLFDQLDNDLQRRVNNRARLGTASTQLEIFTYESGRVAYVEALIKAIPCPDTLDPLTHEDFTNYVVAAEAAFELLEDVTYQGENGCLQDWISDELVQILEDARNALDAFNADTDSVAIAGVNALIAAIPNTVTALNIEAFEADLVAAEVAYLALPLQVRTDRASEINTTTLQARRAALTTFILRTYALENDAVAINALVQDAYDAIAVGILGRGVADHTNAAQNITRANMAEFETALVTAQDAFGKLNSIRVEIVDCQDDGDDVEYKCECPVMFGYVNLQDLVANRARLVTAQNNWATFSARLEAANTVINAVNYANDNRTPANIAFARSARNAVDGSGNTPAGTPVAAGLPRNRVQELLTPNLATLTTTLEAAESYRNAQQITATVTGNQLSWNRVSFAESYTLVYYILSYTHNVPAVRVIVEVSDPDTITHIFPFFGAFVKDIVVTMHTDLSTFTRSSVHIAALLSDTPVFDAWDMLNASNQQNASIVSLLERFLSGKAIADPMAMQAFVQSLTTQHQHIAVVMALFNAAQNNVRNYGAVETFSNSRNTASGGPTVHARGHAIINYDEYGNGIDRFGATYSFGHGTAAAASVQIREWYYHEDGTLLARSRGNNTGFATGSSGLGVNSPVVPVWSTQQTVHSDHMSRWNTWSYHFVDNPFSVLNYTINANTIAGFGDRYYLNPAQTNDAGRTMAPNGGRLHFNQTTNQFEFTLNMIASDLGNQKNIDWAGNVTVTTNAETSRLTFFLDEDLRFVSYVAQKRYNVIAPIIGNANTDSWARTFFVHHTDNVEIDGHEIFRPVWNWNGSNVCDCTDSRSHIIDGGIIANSGYVINLGDINPATAGTTPWAPYTPTCVVEGTLVTLADGTQIPVEDLRPGDMVKAWNFYEGKFDIAPVVLVARSERTHREIIRLDFSDGSQIEVFVSHGFFNKTLLEFSKINIQNAHEFIGHEFKIHTDAMQRGSATLVNVSILTRYVAVYQPSIAFHMAAYTNGLLSVGTWMMEFGLVNLFEVEAGTLRFCVDSRNAVIAEHGLLTFEEFSAVIPGLPIELFNALNGPYLGIAISMGITTWDGFIEFLIASLEFIPL